MARRGHNEGTIYQREDGRWCASISLGYDEKGNRRRKYIYGATRREVSTKLKAAQAGVSAGIEPVRDDRTVAQLVEAWLTDSVRPKTRDSTYRWYEQYSRNHITPYLGREKLSKVDVRMVESWLQERATTGMSSTTVGHLRSILRRIFNVGVRWGWLARNVVEFTEPIKTSRKAPVDYSTDKAQAIMAAITGHRLEPVLTLYLALGLRRAEVLGLRWTDIDLEHGRLTVSSQLQQFSGSYSLQPPKSDSGRRTVALPGFVLAKLQAHKEREDAARRERDRQDSQTELTPARRRAHKQGQDRLGDSWGLVFTTSSGQPINPRNLNRDFYTILDNAKVERITIHNMRHLCASILVSHGVHMQTIKEILGHSDIRLTMNTYSHLLPTSAREAASAIERTLGGK
ncbi:site-specific integrase [Armatimonas sp.]|uniref:tyrosine-type recombinase/integrase n=1 Tax=Armatimonas sp. TaxID=1872638 RepID=UPI00286CD794|nr:site-specific integrase [Armatimonas sp.]